MIRGLCLVYKLVSDSNLTLSPQQETSVQDLKQQLVLLASKIMMLTH